MRIYTHFASMGPIIKPRRSTKLSSFNDVQNEMPQKIRSACLHDSGIGTYPIYIRFISTYKMRPESDLAISECMRFFPVYTVIEQIRSVSHMRKKIGIGSHLTDSVNGAFVVKWLASTSPERSHASSLSCRLTAMSLKLYFRLFEPYKTSSETTIQAKTCFTRVM